MPCRRAVRLRSARAPELSVRRRSRARASASRRSCPPPGWACRRPVRPARPVAAVPASSAPPTRNRRIMARAVRTEPAPARSPAITSIWTISMPILKPRIDCAFLSDFNAVIGDDGCEGEAVNEAEARRDPGFAPREYRPKCMGRRDQYGQRDHDLDGAGRAAAS